MMQHEESYGSGPGFPPQMSGYPQKEKRKEKKEKEGGEEEFKLQLHKSN